MVGGGGGGGGERGSPLTHQNSVFRQTTENISQSIYKHQRNLPRNAVLFPTMQITYMTRPVFVSCDVIPQAYILVLVYVG